MALSRFANRGVPELVDGPTLEVGGFDLVRVRVPSPRTISILDSSIIMGYLENMAKGQRPAGSDKSAIITALPKACADELAAVEFIESLRWSETGPCCQRCGDTDVYKMTDRKTGERNKRFLWKCNGCQKQYTVRVGTVMEDTPHPASALGVCALESLFIQEGRQRIANQTRDGTNLQIRAVHDASHSLRHGGRLERRAKTSGIVEADETYVGGKPRNKQKRKGPRKVGFRSQDCR